MIRNYFALVLISFLFCFIFIKCAKQSIVNPVPKITYQGYSKIPYQNFSTDSLIFIKLEFEDGDGNMGLNINDSAHPFRIGDEYYHNVFVEYMAGKNGVYNYVVNGPDTINYNDRITNIEPDTRNKSISGFMTIKIEPIIGAIVPDSIKLNIYIVDRALNKSNKVSTGAIPVNF